jgi:serine/threonine protein kinase
MAKNNKKSKVDDNLSEDLENSVIDVDALFTKPLKCVDNEGFTDDKRCSNDAVSNYLGFCKKHRVDLNQHASTCKVMCQKLAKLPFLDKIHFMAYICEYIIENIDIFHSSEKFLEGFINKFKTDFKTIRTHRDLVNYKQIIEKYKEYKDQFDDLLEIIKEEKEEREEENDKKRKKGDKKDDKKKGKEKEDKKDDKKKGPKKDKVDRLISEIKKHRKLFRGTYGRVAKTKTEYWTILEEIVSLDPSYSGKSRFELSLEQIRDIKRESMQNPIAIKGTQNFITGNELVEPSTLRERVLLTNYRHPNIVKVLFFHEGEKELVYPMINGGISLESYIKQTHLKERMKHFDYIFYQIIDAINYLHQNGIIHGDLKAKNILINKETRKITLIDFGASSFENSDGFARTLCTYYVSSPEDLSSGKKNGKSSRASDVWAIGMNMIHYLHGEDIIDLLEIDTEDLQDLFKRLQIENTGFDYPLPNEHKRKLQLGKPAKVKVEAKYRKLFLPLLMFDPAKRPTTSDLLGNSVFKSFLNKSINKDSEMIDELEVENVESKESDTLEIVIPQKEQKDVLVIKESLPQTEEKTIIKEEETDETCEQDSYLLVRSDLIMFLYGVLKAYGALHCMVHIVRVLDKYINKIRENKDISQFTLEELFKNKEISKRIGCAVMVLMTSLFVQWRDIFTVEQLEDILDMDTADEIISRVSDVLTVLKYDLYERTFDTHVKIDYEKTRDLLKNNNNFFSLSIDEQVKLYII